MGKLSLMCGASIAARVRDLLDTQHPQKHQQSARHYDSLLDTQHPQKHQQWARHYDRTRHSLRVSLGGGSARREAATYTQDSTNTP
jgi:hypothetical protein